MIRVPVAQRRARLAVRHLLASPVVTDPAEVARNLVALHATDPSSVYLSAWARMAGGDVDGIERALYEDRTLLRVLGMRRTVFVVSRDVAPIVQAACGRAVAARERRKLLGLLAEAGVARSSGSVEGWLKEVEDVTLDALAARHEATAAELAGDDERLRTQLVLSRGKAYEGRQNVASRVLFLLAADGRVVRGRPHGSWSSHQYRWSLAERWVPVGITGWDTAAAETELARRWLGRFGPAPVDDLRWWAGWSATTTRRALARLRPVDVDLDGVPGVALPDDLDPEPEPAPWAALLPALDCTPMGWQQREWFLGEHGPALFDRYGNAGPTVWWRGQVVGGWTQRRDGEVAFRLLEDIGSDATAAVQRAAERLQDQLCEVRLTARTRGATAVERELA